MDCSSPGFLSVTNSQSLLKLTCIESVMPSNHLILCHPLLLLPSIFPSIRVFSNESALHIRWPKYWRFSFNISLPNEHLGLISLGWTGWISLQSKGLSKVFSNTTVSYLRWNNWGKGKDVHSHHVSIQCSTKNISLCNNTMKRKKT